VTAGLARGFASDNFAGAHPDVMAALSAANDGHAEAYGADPWTASCLERFRSAFGADARAFPVFNGTGANVVCLRAALRPFEAVICPTTAHLAVDECGAPEALAGVKLLTVECPDGKLTPSLVEPVLERIGEEHAVQPRLVSISNSTELGTVYSPAEVQALADFARSSGLLLHLDGARLGNAAASSGVSLAALTAEAGVDLLSFGGTKNGLLFGEAVVVFGEELGAGMEFVRKQSMQLASKMRFLSAQLLALLSDELWLRNARHANAMARRLGHAVASIDGVSLAQPVEANAVFASLPRAAISRLLDSLPGELPFYVWDERVDVVRWMCSWDTTEEDVDGFVEALRRAVEPA
jgi:threonine aldolase